MPRHGLQGAAASGPRVEGELNRFLEEINRSVTLPVTVSPARATTAVLGALLHRISRGEGDHLLSELPEALQELLEPGLRDRDPGGERLDFDDFIQAASYEMDIDPEEAEPIVRVVFAVTQNWLPRREEHDVASQLPKELRQVWLHPVPLSTATPRRSGRPKAT